MTLGCSTRKRCAPAAIVLLAATFPLLHLSVTRADNRVLPAHTVVKLPDDPKTETDESAELVVLGAPHFLVERSVVDAHNAGARLLITTEESLAKCRADKCKEERSWTTPTLAFLGGFVAGALLVGLTR